MENMYINYWAVLVAAVSSFILGGLWYSPMLFGKAWMKENGFTDKDLKKHSSLRKFGTSLILSLIMALNLAAFLGDSKTDLTWGITAGSLAGIGWVATSIGIIGVFENKSWRYIMINAGYTIITFIAMGAIIGSWR